MDCNLCHKQNTTVVIPNGEKIKDVLEKLSVWQQIRHWNRRRCSIYIGTCILQIGDGWMDFWETICSRSNSNDGCHFCKPHSFSNLYTKQHCRYFFSFNFRGRRRSKKKCSSSIKVHGWGKLISRVLSLFNTGSDWNHSAVYLLHLGSHCLDTAQDLILVCDSCDANSGQVILVHVHYSL